MDHLVHSATWVVFVKLAFIGCWVPCMWYCVIGFLRLCYRISNSIVLIWRFVSVGIVEPLVGKRRSTNETQTRIWNLDLLMPPTKRLKYLIMWRRRIISETWSHLYHPPLAAYMRESFTNIKVKMEFRRCESTIMNDNIIECSFISKVKQLMSFQFSLAASACSPITLHAPLMKNCSIMNHRVLARYERYDYVKRLIDTMSGAEYGCIFTSIILWTSMAELTF